MRHRLNLTVLLGLMLGLSYLHIAAHAQVGQEGGVAFISERDGWPAVYLSKDQGDDPQRVTGPVSTISRTGWLHTTGEALYNLVPGAEQVLQAVHPASGKTREIWRWDRPISHASPSPAATKMVFSSVAVFPSNQNHLFMLDVASGTVRQATDLAGNSGSPAWSPNGKAIAFCRSQPQGIWLLDPHGGDASRIADGHSPSWSPDGREITFDEGGGIWTMDANGGRRRQVTQPPADHFDRDPDWSPDGSRLAFVRLSPGSESEVMSVGVDGGPVRNLSQSVGVDRRPVWVGPPVYRAVKDGSPQRPALWGRLRAPSPRQ
jgi:Tol biopolymer transport system component